MVLLAVLLAAAPVQAADKAKVKPQALEQGETWLWTVSGQVTNDKSPRDRVDMDVQVRATVLAVEDGAPAQVQLDFLQARLTTPHPVPSKPPRVDARPEEGGSFVLDLHGERPQVKQADGSSAGISERVAAKDTWTTMSALLAVGAEKQTYKVGDPWVSPSLDVLWPLAGFPVGELWLWTMRGLEDRGGAELAAFGAPVQVESTVVGVGNAFDGSASVWMDDQGRIVAGELGGRTVTTMNGMSSSGALGMEFTLERAALP